MTATTSQEHTRDWTKWAQESVKRSVEKVINNHVVASRKNGTTNVSYVGVSTGNADQHQYFSGITLFSPHYKIDSITPAQAYEVWNLDSEKWVSVNTHEINPYDYVTLVTLLEGAVRVIQGVVSKVNEDTISFVGKSYNEVVALYFDHQTHHLYKSTADVTVD